MRDQEQKRYLDAGEILAVRDLKREELFVAEWNGWVCVQELSMADKEWFQAEAIDTTTTVTPEGQTTVTSTPRMVGLNGKLLSRALVDRDTGKRMFDDAEADILGSKSAEAVGRIVEVAMRLSKMGKFGVRTAEKNSDSAPSDGSSSGSPLHWDEP